MLKLSEQAEAILTQLRTITGLNHVDTLEGIDMEELRRPASMPRAQLLLAAEPSRLSAASISSKTAWSVLVTAKTMAGPSGLMAMVDAVLDALTGFQAVVGARPLFPKKIEFVDRGAEPSAYLVTFTSTQDASVS